MRVAKFIIWALLLVAVFAWGVLTVRLQVFPFSTIQAVVRSEAIPGVRSRTVSRGDERSNRLRYFELSTQNPDVTFLGDSFTAYFPWHEVFPDLSISNRGYGGETIDGLAMRLDQALATQAKLYVIMIGINDLAFEASTDTVFAKYRTILDQLTHSGAAVIVQSTLRCRFAACPYSKIDDLNARLLQHASTDDRVHFIDLNKVLRDTTGVLAQSYTYDDLHLTTEGYAQWLGALRPVISMALDANRN